MKKLILLTAIALMIVTPAFAAKVVKTTAAAAGVSSAGGETMAAVTPAQLDIGRSSKGVLYGWQTSTTGYAIDTYHTQGTKFYGTAYDSTALYFKDMGVSATFVQPTSSVAADAFSGWTAM
jgi:hypothetical protein